ncbi:hypothetical protein LTR53_012117 [Teratosphaeriaceae sp. CCFEE 6253]|nr:hypothetical protein LTR53_012117 [Teratosphaeriaceae sp. CCFEE 6253]
MRWRDSHQCIDGSHESKETSANDEQPLDAQHETELLDVDAEAAREDEDRLDTPIGQDDASDTRLEHIPWAAPPTATESQTSIQADLENGADTPPDDSDDDFLDVPMPLEAPSSVTTFAYQLALRNRIKEGQLKRHGEYDMRSYKPVFVHDCLMLPGSLASLLSKHPTELTNRTTPALLPGFHAHVHADTQQPCNLQSPNTADYVQGLVVFGLGTVSRRRIHEHYRRHARRVKVEVEIEVAVPVMRSDRDFEHERWRLRRRRVEAYVWLHANAGTGDAVFRSQAPRGWSLEGYLGGDFEADRRLAVVEAWPDYDGGVNERESDVGIKKERKEAWGGGGGSREYLRGNTFTGW